MRLVRTDDGSHTIYSEQFGEHYHSTHGAIQESEHVFIASGLKETGSANLSILEIGFGTGLNTLLSLIYGREQGLAIRYTAVELFPLTLSEIQKINYPEKLGYAEEYVRIHAAKWEEAIEVFPDFKLKKIKADLTDVKFSESFDLIYFDAFSPEVQPELWETKIFEKIAKACNSGAILTTYSAKGSVRRSLQSVGFEVERIPGPPGKREILRARKEY